MGGDGGGGGITWQRHTQIVKFSFQAYRHGESGTRALLNLPYLQLHATLVCRLQFGSSLQKGKKMMVEVKGWAIRAKRGCVGTPVLVGFCPLTLDLHKKGFSASSQAL